MWEGNTSTLKSKKCVKKVWSCANKVWGKGQNRPKSRDERLNEHVEQQYC